MVAKGEAGSRGGDGSKGVAQGSSLGLVNSSVS